MIITRRLQCSNQTRRKWAKQGKNKRSNLKTMTFSNDEEIKQDQDISADDALEMSAEVVVVNGKVEDKDENEMESEEADTQFEEEIIQDEDLPVDDEMEVSEEAEVEKEEDEDEESVLTRNQKK